MNIKDITFNSLEIPFRVEFKHASASRNVTSTAWVVARSEQHTGYGESCPREYVTGETMESVKLFFESHKDNLQDIIGSLASLLTWSLEHRNEIDRNPAAWCAIELALLDLLAQEADQSIEQLLGLPGLSGEFQYTAVLGDNKIEQFAQQVDQYAAMAFKDYKIKLSGDLEKDKEKLHYLVGANAGARIRLDANNLWQQASGAIAYLNSLEIELFAIEEPLSANDYDGLREVTNTAKTKIILDESFLREEQFALIKDDPANWIINLRVSKMGGLLRSLKIALMARSYGIGIIIGAQVGETSLLTRSALTVANANRDILIAQEGAYGTILLEKDICQPPLMFGKGGRIAQDQLNHIGDRGFGLGINVDGININEMVVT
jgi:L-alanine-DL-glutamate epimerase-like enolase superfamily enzyme